MEYEDVASLIEELEQAPWVEWGLWGEEDLPGQTVRIQAANFAEAASVYLQKQEPPDTPALRLQRALSTFLGRG
jgi:hypothetical protein